MKDFLIKKLVSVYEMHDYEASPEKMKYLITCMDKSYNIDKCTEKEIDEFVDNVEAGLYGILYKQPTCISQMWTKFTEGKPRKRVVPTTTYWGQQNI